MSRPLIQINYAEECRGIPTGNRLYDSAVDATLRPRRRITSLDSERRRRETRSAARRTGMHQAHNDYNAQRPEDWGNH